MKLFNGPLGRSSAIVPALLILLLMSISAFYVMYSRMPPPLAEPYQQPLVKRAEREAARALRKTPEAMPRISYPIVMRLTDRTCVELNSVGHRERFYLACYDNSTGELVEERISNQYLGK